MTTASATRTCQTCRRDQGPEEFYASSTECRACKRQRSQQNRADAAFKIALAERLIEVLARLADQGVTPEALLLAGPNNKAAPGGAGTPTEGLDRQVGATQ